MCIIPAMNSKTQPNRMQIFINRILNANNVRFTDFFDNSESQTCGIFAADIAGKTLEELIRRLGEWIAGVGDFQLVF